MTNPPDKPQAPRPFLTYPAVIDWLQWSEEFEERLDKPNMPQVTLSLIHEYKTAYEALQKELEEQNVMAQKWYDACQSTQKENERLREALEDAINSIHSEYCGDICHPCCERPTEALKGWERKK